MAKEFADYLKHRAKRAKSDVEAKTWLLTAELVFRDNAEFAVNVYQAEKAQSDFNKVRTTRKTPSRRFNRLYFRPRRLWQPF